MSARLPIPLAQRQNRLPEAGRIRIGVKTAKAMKAIDTFRFTSHRREDLEQLAALYGGQVRPWSDPKAAAGQYEVITEAREISVALPPDPLGDTPRYRMYGGGGPERACNGVTCERWRKGPEGPEPYEVDCICAAQGALECDVTTMLSVLIPEIRLSGTWRIVTKSENASKELPGMVALVADLQGRGLALGTLAIEERREVHAGETRVFKVPVLGTSATVNEITAGAGVLGGALPSGQPNGEQAALTSGGGGERPAGDHGGSTSAEAPASAESTASSPAPPSSGVPAEDEDIVDAEIVEEGADAPAGGGAGVEAGDRVRGGAPSTDVDVADLESLMSDRGLGKAAVRKEYNRLAKEAGQATATGWRDLAPGPVLDATFAWVEAQPVDGDDEPPNGGGTPAPPPRDDEGGEAVRTPATQEATQQALVARVAEMFPTGRQDQDDRRHAIVTYATHGATSSSKDCDKDQLLACHRVVDGLVDGSLVCGLFDDSSLGYLVLPREEAA